MIEVLQLSCRVGDFSLEVPRLRLLPGITALLGPSGSGKTVLLKTVAGLLRQRRGRLLCGDDDWFALPAHRRPLALVFQQAALFPHLSVRANIAYGPRARGVERRRVRRLVDEMVERLGIARLLGRPVATLSGGEAQMVALARALVNRPRLLLLDEPLGQVDAHERRQLARRLREVVAAEPGLACLHVTHDRAEAESLAERLAVLVGGRLVQQGDRQRLQRQPACAFVATLLGVPAPGAGPDCGRPCLTSRDCPLPPGSGDEP